MAVGESTGQEATPRVVSSRPTPPNAGDAADELHRRTEAPLLKEADPEFEKLLTEEEEIERQAQSRSKGPEHFRPNEGE
jgi:small subunit ribosomal protein S3